MSDADKNRQLDEYFAWQPHDDPEFAGLIYGKDMPLKSMIQLYALAAVFLVLLYNSPAGLVFYWTLNNVFSLCKNIVIS